MSNKDTGAVTSKQDQQGGLVPTRRFPEFQDARAWQKVALKNVLRPAIREIAKPGSSYTGLGLRSHGKGTFQKTGQDPDKNSMDRLYVVHRNDLIVNITFAWEGAIAIADDSDHGCYVSHRFPTYEFKSGISSPDFFRYVITDKAFVYRLGVISPGGAGRNRVMNKNDFLSISTLLPSVSEQQKIADCLSSIDALIAAEIGKLDALKDHKKGLMQQLFPAPGETTPRLRFPEFRNAGEWEEAKLGDIGELVGGLTYSPDDVRKGGLLVLRSSNIQNGQIALDDCVYVTPNIRGANLAKADDILICVRNGSTALIGKNALIPEGMPVCTHGAFMTVFRSRTARFVFQLFQTSAYRQQVAADLGATINSINGSQFLQYEFYIPSEAEQRKIADCLSSIDSLINAQGDKIDALKAHKKGLMQQLFPVADEVQA